LARSLLIRKNDVGPRAVIAAISTAVHHTDLLLLGLRIRKSFTIGTMMGMRPISVTCVVLGNNLDVERGRMSPKSRRPCRKFSHRRQAVSKHLRILTECELIARFVGSAMAWKISRFMTSSAKTQPNVAEACVNQAVS